MTEEGLKSTWQLQFENKIAKKIFFLHSCCLIMKPFPLRHHKCNFFIQRNTWHIRFAWRKPVMTSNLQKYIMIMSSGHGIKTWSVFVCLFFSWAIIKLLRKTINHVGEQPETSKCVFKSATFNLKLTDKSMNHSPTLAVNRAQHILSKTFVFPYCYILAR